MRKNKRGGIANLFEIIGSSLFLLVLFLIFCSGLVVDFNRVNVKIQGDTAGYNHDITMQSYLRAPVFYENKTISMLELMNIAIANGEFELLEKETKKLLSQYVYDNNFWYVGVWDMHPNDFDTVMNEYLDYDDFEDLMEEEPGKEIGMSKLLVSMHQLKPKDKGENKELQFMQIPYLSSREKEFMILVFQVGEAK
ncbi:hypothetical protein KY335_04770 [Candidatus Woesearchaeota archaeon]|nr:hypothetical protein [Candidatus Woesearchaeota archaeon]